MHRSTVAFAIQAPEDVARDRVRAVLRFYDVCGELELRLRRDRALGLTVGEILIGSEASARATRGGMVFSAGEALPPGLTTAPELLDASDARLRAADGAQAAVAVRDGRARIVSGAGSPGTWFQAGDAYATSIAAAALLGAVGPLLDPDSLPELLMLGTCLGRRTHLKGVRAMPPSAVVDFGSGEREAWPRLSRWAAVDPKKAPGQAWRALVETVASRLEPEPSPWVLLDENGDAALLAAAADAREIDLPGFTGDDQYGAAVRIETPERGREQVLRNALLGDGMHPLNPFEIPGQPPRASSVVTAFGGQIATGTSYPHRLLDLTPADHRGAIEIKLREWFEEAAESGGSKWSTTDMLLIEEGVGESGRADHRHGTREPFRSPEVARALSSIPPQIRARGDWKRNAAGDFAVVPARSVDEQDHWERLPEIASWLVDEPLSQPLLRTGLGDLWVERLKDGVRDGDPTARQQALQAAAAALFGLRLQAAAQPLPGAPQSHS